MSFAFKESFRFTTRILFWPLFQVGYKTILLTRLLAEINITRKVKKLMTMSEQTINVIITTKGYDDSISWLTESYSPNWTSIKKKCQTCTFSSFIIVALFLLFCLRNWMCLCFGILVEQTETFENITLLILNIFHYCNIIIIMFSS